ncbi:MAG: dihydropyrimidinase [Candidatus Eisenbacteria bacterium]|nr:dihydropyrimidinase [Candidatus Eisenbacteria bacterium]
MGILIKNGTLVTASEQTVADVYCDGGQVVALGRDLEKRGAKDEVIDASGQYVLPGAVDPHVHLALPFMGTVSADDYEAGTACALAGGTTTVVDFVIPARGGSLLEGLREWEAKSKIAVADYTYHMSIPGWSDKTAEEMRIVVQEKGITSFKVFMAYKGAFMLDDGELWQVMKHAARLGAVVTVHAENGDAVANLQAELVAAGKTEPKYHAVSRPSAVEGEATGRALMMARLNGATAYIVHMTCRESIQALARAKAEGQHCYGETCPQYLLLDDSVYEKPNFEGSVFVMSPPIRSRREGHQDALWSHLGNGILNAVGTDFCPFTFEQKRMGLEKFTLIPNGGTGIEERLALLYTYGVCEGRISLQRMVELISTAPARIFGLYPRKGSICVGGDADLVVWDPASERTISAKTHHSGCDRNIFEGFKVKGKPSYVVAGGRVQFKDGDLRVQRGAGRFLKREIQTATPVMAGAARAPERAQAR